MRAGNTRWKLHRLARVAAAVGLMAAMAIPAAAKPGSGPDKTSDKAKPAATDKGPTAPVPPKTDDAKAVGNTKSATKSQTAPVNLFPKSVFAIDPSLQPLQEAGPRPRHETPSGASFALGDDRDWRVQAAQVGVMAGLFAALVALCDGGKCMLRDKDGPSKAPSRDGEVLRQDREPTW